MWIISYRDDITYDNLQDMSDYVWATGKTKKECERDWVDRTRNTNYSLSDFLIYEI